jgi:putative ABC transport system permease protein
VLFQKITLRHWRRQPKSTLLLVAILAIGVGVFLSVRLANKAAVAGFRLFTDSIAGESDFILRANVGDLPETLLPEIRKVLDPLPVGIFPILESTASMTAVSGAKAYRLVGVDLVSLNNAVYLEERSRSSEPLKMKLGDSRQVLVGESSLLKGGDVVPLIIDDRAAEVEVAVVLPDDPLRPDIPENLILFDLSGLQKLIGKEGRISRAELKIPPGADRAGMIVAVEERLLAAAAGRFVLDTPDDQQTSAEQMSAAFRLNLSILSTLALIVGVYLIFQALEASVVKRRSEIAILRSLGVEQWRIQRAWLIESVLIGVLGSGFGVVLGFGIAQLTVGSIAATVNTLYFENTTTAARLDFGEAMFAFLFGVGASAVAGLIPAREAASTHPAQTLRSGIRSPGLTILRKPWIGVGLVVLAIGLSLLPPIHGEGELRIPLAGYGSALSWLLGLSILAGLLFPLVRRVLAFFGGTNVSAKYAASQFRNPEGRHRLTAAGLLVAVGMAAGMAILVSSFEHTLTSWIQNLLKADLYVATAGTANISNENRILPDTWAAIEAHPDVEGVDLLRKMLVRIDGRETWLAGANYNQKSDRRLRLIWVTEPEDADAEHLKRPLAAGAIPVWVSETFARRFPGETIVLPINGEDVLARVMGVYADYGNERGTVLVHRSWIVRWFNDRSVNSVAVYLKPGEDAEMIRGEFASQFPYLVTRSNRTLREESITIFHQTFSVTYALEAIAIFVAVAGLGMALAGLLIERRPELRTLREIGFSRRQIASATMWEGLGLGLVGTVGGVLLGLALGHLLIFVVNKQSFGWTLSYHVPVLLIGAIVLLTLLTAMLVAFCVGRYGSKLRAEQEE